MSCTPLRPEPEELSVSADDLLTCALEKSDALHSRVRRFARSQFPHPDLPAAECETFEELALDISRYQYEFSPAFARSVARKNNRLQAIEDIPAIPTDVFRLCRVAVHPKQLDSLCFRTSGTTGEQTGSHPVRSLETKNELSIIQAKHSLFKDHKRAMIVALAAPVEGRHSSSLSHMMELFMDNFDGRALCADPQGVKYRSQAPERWLLGTQGIDLEGLARAARLAIHRSEPLFILCTSFALMAMIESLDGEKVRTPSRTFVMLTGGFKGRKHSLNESELRSAAAHSLGISPSHIVGEYGMTELTSQLFEEENNGLYRPPPWLKVQAVNPSNHAPVHKGDSGLAHFIDLGNVDSCLSVVTQDLICDRGDCVQLLGRAPQAPTRGCSLPFEALLSPPLETQFSAAKNQGNRLSSPNPSTR